MSAKQNSKGFSLIEIVIVLAILAVLSILAIFFFQRHVGRARDAQRKADLGRLKVAFEDYYNDHFCYPPPEVLLDCGEDTLQPYINSIPCDPRTNEPYEYFSRFHRSCMGVKILADLEVDNDPEIEAIGCSFTEGCGWEGHPEYNYGVAVGDSIVSDSWSYGGSQDDGSNNSRYYCIMTEAGANCTSLSYENLLYYSCPTSFIGSSECLSQCVLMEGLTQEEWEQNVLCEEL